MPFLNMENPSNLSVYVSKGLLTGNSDVEQPSKNKKVQSPLDSALPDFRTS